MVKRAVKGKCHICGQVKELSYEHVPPAKAFNSTPTKVYKAVDVITEGGIPWDVSNIKGKILQRGSGGYTLCRSCNSYTGAKYAQTFIDACDQVLNRGHVEIQKDGLRAKVGLLDINPLFFAKQVLAMFASVGGEGFFEAQPVFRELVLNEKKYGIDVEEYALFMYLYQGGMSRQSGWSVQMRKDGNVIMAAELTTMPFGFALVHNPNREILTECGTEVTGLLNQYESTTVGNFLFELPIYQQNSPMPLDFRTKDEIKTGKK